MAASKRIAELTPSSSRLELLLLNLLAFPLLHCSSTVCCWVLFMFWWFWYIWNIISWFSLPFSSCCFLIFFVASFTFDTIFFLIEWSSRLYVINHKLEGKKDTICWCLWEVLCMVVNNAQAFSIYSPRCFLKEWMIKVYNIKNCIAIIWWLTDCYSNTSTNTNSGTTCNMVTDFKNRNKLVEILTSDLSDDF